MRVSVYVALRSLIGSFGCGYQSSDSGYHTVYAARFYAIEAEGFSAFYGGSNGSEYYLDQTRQSA